MSKSVSVFFADIEPNKIGERVYSFFDGVEVGLRPSKKGDSVYIMKIRSRDRGKGKASSTLAAICDAADRASVDLFLEIEESDGLSKHELANWYWRFGFRGDTTEMIRKCETS
jgi:hypothetical protein